MAFPRSWRLETQGQRGYLGRSLIEQSMVQEMGYVSHSEKSNMSHSVTHKICPETRSVVFDIVVEVACTWFNRRNGQGRLERRETCWTEAFPGCRGDLPTGRFYCGQLFRSSPECIAVGVLDHTSFVVRSMATDAMNSGRSYLYVIRTVECLPTCLREATRITGPWPLLYPVGMHKINDRVFQQQ
jgi:hypothetical protein